VEAVRSAAGDQRPLQAGVASPAAWVTAQARRQPRAWPLDAGTSSSGRGLAGRPAFRALRPGRAALWRVDSTAATRAAGSGSSGAGRRAASGRGCYAADVGRTDARRAVEAAGRAADGGAAAGRAAGGRGCRPAADGRGCRPAAVNPS